MWRASTRQWEADSAATDALVAAQDNWFAQWWRTTTGYVFATMGDGFAVAFERASDSVTAALELQASLIGPESAPDRLRVEWACIQVRRSSVTATISVLP